MSTAQTFTSVSVAGAPPVEFCVDLLEDDAVGAWFLNHDSIDEPVQRLFLDLVDPGSRVLDLGAHLGTFALPAAGLGAQVIAVDARESHVDLVHAAAERNGFEALFAVHAAIGDGDEPGWLVGRGIHGHVTDLHTVGAERVPAASVDGLLAAHGWDGADVIKIDVEGSEVAALRGAAELFASGARPSIVFECNAGTLPHFGESTERLRALLEDLGYRLWFIDHLRPGTLVESSSAAPQPEAVSDYLAAVELPARVAERWSVEPAFSPLQSFTRLLDAVSGPGHGYRELAARQLGSVAHPLADSARRALRLDIDNRVRVEVGPDPARSERWSSLSGELGDLDVVAEDVGVRMPTGELERAERREFEPSELLVHGVSFHVRRGQMLAIVSEHAEPGRQLLRAVAGITPCAVGDLRIGRPPVLVPLLGHILDPRLGVRRNAAILGAYLGCDVSDVERRLDDVAERFGFADGVERPLGDARVDTAVRLVLGIALRLSTAPLLLLDEFPTPVAPDLAAVLEHELAVFRSQRRSLIQLVREPSHLLAAPDRTVWIDRGAIVGCGHPESLAEEWARRRAGFAQ